MIEERILRGEREYGGYIIKKYDPGTGPHVSREFDYEAASGTTDEKTVGTPEEAERHIDSLNAAK